MGEKEGSVCCCRRQLVCRDEALVWDTPVCCSQFGLQSCFCSDSLMNYIHTKFVAFSGTSGASQTVTLEVV